MGSQIVCRNPFRLWRNNSAFALVSVGARHARSDPHETNLTDYGSIFFATIPDNYLALRIELPTGPTGSDRFIEPETEQLMPQMESEILHQ